MDHHQVHRRRAPPRAPAPGGRRRRSRRSRRAGSSRCRCRPGAPGAAATAVGDLGHRQVRQDAGEEAARPQQHQVGLGDRLERRRVGRRAPAPARPAGRRRRRRRSASRRRRACRRRARPRARTCASVEGSTRPLIFRTREHSWIARSKLPVTSESAARKRLPNEWPVRSPSAKRCWKSRAEQRLVVGQGHQAVADVAGRQHAQLPAQPARRAAVVGHRDDRRQVHRRALEAAQQRRQPRAAAERGDPGPAPGPSSAESTCRGARRGAARRAMWRCDAPTSIAPSP